MLAAAPIKCRRLQLVWIIIICGSNKMSSAAAPTNHDHPRPQWNTIGRGSNKILSTAALTEFHWPSHLHITIIRGSYSIMLAAAPIKFHRPWYLTIIVRTIIHSKQNISRWSEASLSDDNFWGVLGPITHLGWHWHGSLHPEMYAPCEI